MKETQITVRLTSDQKEALRDKAAKAGLDISAYVRIMVLRDLGLIK